jgi:RES domain-containing protein
MLDGNALADALRKLPTVSFAGTLYRAIDYEALHGFHSPTSYQPNPLYCHGAVVNGARYTPRGGMASLYLAEEYTTAYEEANQAFLAVQAINPKAVRGIPPTVLLSARAEIATVLDISDPAVQHALSTNLAELTAPWRLFQRAGGIAPTQVLAQTVFDEKRFQAIR